MIMMAKHKSEYEFMRQELSLFPLDVDHKTMIILPSDFN